jgi:hypothetical protein
MFPSHDPRRTLPPVITTADKLAEYMHDAVTDEDVMAQAAITLNANIFTSKDEHVIFYLVDGSKYIDDELARPPLCHTSYKYARILPLISVLHTQVLTETTLKCEVELGKITMRMMSASQKAPIAFPNIIRKGCVIRTPGTVRVLTVTTDEEVKNAVKYLQLDPTASYVVDTEIAFNTWNTTATCHLYGHCVYIKVNDTVQQVYDTVIDQIDEKMNQSPRVVNMKLPAVTREKDRVDEDRERELSVYEDLGMSITIPELLRSSDPSEINAESVH